MTAELEALLAPVTPAELVRHHWDRQALHISGPPGKFAGLYPLRETRRQLLLIGADLHDSGLLDQPDDIMFLTLDEAHTAVHQGVDLRGTVTARRAVHRRELRRRTVPVALLWLPRETVTITEPLCPTEPEILNAAVPA